MTYTPRLLLDLGTTMALAAVAEVQGYDHLAPVLTAQIAELLRERDEATTERTDDDDA